MGLTPVVQKVDSTIQLVSLIMINLVDSIVQHLKNQSLFKKFKGGGGMSQGIWEGSWQKTQDPTPLFGT